MKNKTISPQITDKLLEQSILRIGEVCEIEGKRIFILLDKNKNASDLLFNGTVLKNVSVGSFIEIRKGFLSIICKVEGEKLVDEHTINNKRNPNYEEIDKNKRILSASVSGFIESDNKFIGGIKELPLIGNEAFILTEDKIHLIHRLTKKGNNLTICVAYTDKEEIPIDFPVDNLFNSHIAIFGNTGSGKSNTLVSLYKSFIEKLSTRKNFKNCRFFIFDFNGEFTDKKCFTENKTCYILSTQDDSGDKIPIKFDDLMNIENLSLLFDATEKTQKPFLNRVLKYYKFFIKGKEEKGFDDYYNHFQNTLKLHIRNVLTMSNKEVALKILDYLEEILGYFTDMDNEKSNIFFHDTNKYFYLSNLGKAPHEAGLQEHPDLIDKAYLMPIVDNLDRNKLNKMSIFHLFYIFILMQFIKDLENYHVQVEHILPLISRFKSKQTDLEKIFNLAEKSNIWATNNVIVLNMLNINIEMKKTIPLLIAKYIYNIQKLVNRKKDSGSLSIIIDEAHNILSKESFREKEDWKDYRLETFEEIIKEGRKFGIFVTIASQRPNDISETIISQAHNYFIHQLINQNDLRTIGNAVSYIDKVTEESIPTLPVGTCIFSGIATPMPLKIKVYELPDEEKPQSKTLQFSDITEENVIYL
jgi:DNA helicase HerA-like ATPase